MAISFVGSCVTPPIPPYRGLLALAVENSAFSRVAVRIRRLVAQMENLELITTSGAYMPILRTFRQTGVASGGIELAKTAFDSQLASDAGVRILARVDGIGPSHNLAVTGSPVGAWSHFTARRPTGVEQQLAEDISLLPILVENSPYWILYPGEVLTVQMLQGSATMTLGAGGLFYTQMVWEEEDSFDVGYTISGEVTLDSAPVVGAKVFVLTDLTIDMTDPKLKIKITGAGGAWSETLASGVKAAAFVQHKEGANKYTDEGKPYLEKP